MQTLYCVDCILQADLLCAARTNGSVIVYKADATFNGTSVCHKHLAKRDPRWTKDMQIGPIP